MHTPSRQVSSMSIKLKKIQDLDSLPIYETSKIDPKIYNNSCSECNSYPQRPQTGQMKAERLISRVYNEFPRLRKFQRFLVKNFIEISYPRTSV